MLLENSIKTHDLSSVDYLKRQLDAITPDQIELAASKVRPSGNFHYQSGYWEPNAYTGFAILAMVNSSEPGLFLNFRLQEIQDMLREDLEDDGAYYMLPTESLHQTIANTLSNEPFQKNIVALGLESDFPEIVTKAFDNIPTGAMSWPLKMRIIGLSIFGTALGVLGVFDSDEDYNRIKSFRHSFYSDPHLNKIGVQMTRPFIGHVTLGYVEKDLTEKSRQRLATIVNTINQNLMEEPFYFFISNAELRRYRHLAEFRRELHYPTYHFKR